MLLVVSGMNSCLYHLSSESLRNAIYSGFGYVLIDRSHNVHSVLLAMNIVKEREY